MDLRMDPGAAHRGHPPETRKSTRRTTAGTAAVPCETQRLCIQSGVPRCRHTSLQSVLRESSCSRVSPCCAQDMVTCVSVCIKGG